MRQCFSCKREYDEGCGICPHCGAVQIAAPFEPIHLAPGTILANRYIIGQAIGQGGFGIVYSAWDGKLGVIVAIKEFYVSHLVARAEGVKELIVSKKSLQEFEYRKERFLAEARNMAKFGAHRSIPNVFEFFEENNTAYIVMELMRGMPLNEYLNHSGGKIEPELAMMIANEVGNALKSMHKMNIIHRDVAPDNIYLCNGKEIRVKLMDLGAAKLAEGSDNVVDIILKPGYSPTEQYDNSCNIGPWTDIYALGATLYVMLTGIKPSESTNRMIKDDVVAPHVIDPSIPENLSNAIMKAMAIEQHMRFKNVQDFLLAINGKKKTTSLEKERRKRKLGRLGGVAAACAVLLAGGLLAYNLFSGSVAEAELESADITVWFSVANGSTEAEAMQAVKQDFESKFEGVTVELVAIPEDEYAERLYDAATSGKLPTLFESTGFSEESLSFAAELDDVIRSEQFKNAMFLNQYSDYYTTRKKVPLAIEVPTAYVITSGATSVSYDSEYFGSLSSFNTANIAYDTRYEKLISPNFALNGLCDRSEFLNNTANTSAVLISSTMILNEVRTTLTNYEKAVVSYSADEIFCRFTYEWSIGSGDKAELEAAKRLLSWMLGNVYQNYLMISECNDGQIPVNAISFETKLQSKYLASIKNTYKNFVFEREAN